MSHSVIFVYKDKHFLGVGDPQDKPAYPPQPGYPGPYPSQPGYQVQAGNPGYSAQPGYQ